MPSFSVTLNKWSVCLLNALTGGMLTWYWLSSWEVVVAVALLYLVWCWFTFATTRLFSPEVVGATMTTGAMLVMCMATDTSSDVRWWGLEGMCWVLGHLAAYEERGGKFRQFQWEKVFLLSKQMMVMATNVIAAAMMVRAYLRPIPDPFWLVLFLGTVLGLWHGYLFDKNLYGGDWVGMGCSFVTMLLSISASVFLRPTPKWIVGCLAVLWLAVQAYLFRSYNRKKLC